MTESERKTSLFISLFVILLVLIAAFLLYRSTRPTFHVISLNGQQFKAEAATTPASREKGLSGRESLEQGHAMVFSFEAAANECFWMRDMKFSIDMVWVDTQNKVSSIERNVKPDTYPQNFCHVGKSVVELPAGTADQLNLKIGDQTDL